MKNRKEEILRKYANGWVGGMTSGDKDRIVYPAMEEYAYEIAVGFCDWLDTHKYEFETIPSDILYQQYLESIPQPSK